jgi:secondary thiamine-phosphate synthase enzyme
MHALTLRTASRFEMTDITDRINDILRDNGIVSGIAIVFVPHTTAAVTINENADPDVPRDILASLDRAVPLKDRYLQTEGNSAAHIKASLVGNSEILLIEEGRLALGTWQSVFFCEFDGPRTRRIWIKLMRTA